MRYKGRVHKFGDDINTDEIIPARYLNTIDPSELARHCMEGADKNFAKTVKRGDIIVAGKNFGCGSSREHAPIAIKMSGISCVIAESFARIFFRNSINIGLPIIECKVAVREIKARDLVRVNTRIGIVRDLTKRRSYRFDRYPTFMQRIVRARGLMNYIKKRLK